MAKQRTVEIEVTEQTAIIEVPLGTVTDSEYLSNHVESRLKDKEKLIFRRIFRGLQERGATTNDGRPVKRAGDVVRWMLDQIEAP
jgi:polysaccharide deacetylase 2 family uncharacterized protein YibQ